MPIAVTHPVGIAVPVRIAVTHPVGIAVAAVPVPIDVPVAVRVPVAVGLPVAVSVAARAGMSAVAHTGTDAVPLCDPIGQSRTHPLTVTVRRPYVTGVPSARWA
jgi:hypothetical protein